MGYSRQLFYTATNASSTGLNDGGLLSINADNTKVDISAGEGRIVDDFTNPGESLEQKVKWEAIVGVVLPDITTTELTFIGLDSDANVILQDADFSQVQRRDIIKLGAAFHPSTIVSAVGNTPIPSYDTPNALNDLISSFGDLLISGGILTAYDTNLQIGKSESIVFARGKNKPDSNKSPNIRTGALLDPVPNIVYDYRDGSGGNTTFNSTTVDPAQWDDGSGVLQSVPSNRWTIQPFYNDTNINLIGAEIGQSLYKSIGDAYLNLGKEPFVTDPNTVPSCYIGSLILRGDVTDLQGQPDRWLFVPANNLGQPSVVVPGGEIPGGSIVASNAQVNEYTADIVLDDSVGNEFFNIDATSGPRAYTLPTAIGNTNEYWFRKSDASSNAVTINTILAQTINGIPAILLTTQYDLVSIKSDGANWMVTTLSGFPNEVAWERSTGTATMSDNIKVHLCNSTSAYTLTLPAHKAGRDIRIVNENRGRVTLSPTSGTIKGSTTEVLRWWESIILISDGTNWS